MIIQNFETNEVLADIKVRKNATSKLKHAKVKEWLAENGYKPQYIIQGILPFGSTRVDSKDRLHYSAIFGEGTPLTFIVDGGCI